MARIQAGNTLVNQYAPPFVVSDNVAQGWELVWNSTLQAFEAVDPSLSVIESGLESIEVAFFPNVSQQSFIVPWVAESKQSLIITIDGVKQNQEAYTIMTDTLSSTTKVTLDGSVSNESVEIVGLQATGAGATVNVQQFIGDGVEVDFNLSWLAPNAPSLIVTLDGVKQQASSYSVLSAPNNFEYSTVRFTEAPGVNASSVSVAGGGTLGGTGYTVNDILYVTGGTLKGSVSSPSTAKLRVTQVDNGGAGPGAVTGVVIIYDGDYLELPTNPVSVTGGTGNDDAQFNLGQTGEIVEVVGLVTAGETPASPVSASNLNSTVANATTTPATNVSAELYRTKRISGNQQILDFAELVAGSGVNFAYNADPITTPENVNSIIISADQPTFATSGGSGQLPVVDETADPIVFRVFKTKADAATAEGGLAMELDGNDLVIRREFGYNNTTSNDYDMGVNERTLGLRNFTATKTVTLPPIANVRPGEKITIKDELGGATSTFTVTIDTPGIETIDTNVSVVGINSSFGYITLYRGESDWHIIGQG